MDSEYQEVPVESAGGTNIMNDRVDLVKGIDNRTIRIKETILFLSVFILLGVGCGIATTILSGLALDNTIKLMAVIDSNSNELGAQNNALTLQNHKLHSYALAETIKICFGDKPGSNYERNKSMLRFMLSENHVSRSDMYGNALKFVAGSDVAPECISMIYITVGLSNSSGEMPEEP